MDFFIKAMSEAAENKLSETSEMPKFFEDLPESQEDTDTPVATIEKPRYSGESLLSDALYASEVLTDQAPSESNAVQVRDLCNDISSRMLNDEVMEARGNLLPEYQRLMDFYEDVEEMCNAEGLNLDEVYNDEPYTYSEEYKRGFVEAIDSCMSPYMISEDQYSVAYYQGIVDAKQLQDLL